MFLRLTFISLLYHLQHLEARTIRINQNLVVNRIKSHVDYTQSHFLNGFYISGQFYTTLLNNINNVN